MFMQVAFELFCEDETMPFFIGEGAHNLCTAVDVDYEGACGGGRGRAVDADGDFVAVVVTGDGAGGDGDFGSEVCSQGFEVVLVDLLVDGSHGGEVLWWWWRWVLLEPLRKFGVEVCETEKIFWFSRYTVHGGVLKLFLLILL